MAQRALRGSYQGHGGSSSDAGVAPGKRARTDGTRRRSADLWGRMERAFGADFSDVLLNTDSAETEGAGARAMAEGNEVSFAPGNFDPDSDQGVELIAHELAHVVQQRQGRVTGPQGKGGEVRSAELEREADDVAARVVAGGAADMGEVPASGASTARQLKQNEIKSVVYSGLDPKTGLEEHQAEIVDTFVKRVEQAVGTWGSQRATIDLIFRADGDVKQAFHWFREVTMKDPMYFTMRERAAQRLQLGKTAAFAQEIRLFNPTMLIDLKGLLGLEDAEDSHYYQYRPLWGIGGTIGKHGVKVGAIAKEIEVKYTCSAIPGLEWTQVVFLKGWVLGAGFSLSSLKKDKDGEREFMKENKKSKGQGSASGPGGWSPEELTEKDARRRYLPPSFFDGADFNSPSGSASASLGQATAKKDLGSALLIQKGAEQLMWESGSSAIISSAEISFDPESLDPLAPDAGAEVSQEVGVTSLVGGTTFQAGAWADVDAKQDESKAEWTALHAARIFFDTGDPVLWPNDWDTLQRLCTLIREWDDKPDHRGSEFRVVISGCHSQRWKDADDTLRELDERRDEDGQLSKRDARREADVLGKKGAENYELALMRASNTHMVFSMLLGRLSKHLSLHVQANSAVEPPTTHTPLQENRFGNAENDRSVTISVWYRV